MSDRPAPSRRTFAVVFLTIFLDLVGFGIIIPIQPFYAETFGASPAMVTLLGASYSAAQFLFVPLWGRLSDRIGRRPVLLISIAMAAVGYVAFGLAPTLAMLFAARILSGIGTANIATAQAIMADLTDAENRTKGMALIGVAFGLGFIVGPALGGVFGQFGIAVPAFVAAALSVLNLILAAALVPETHPPEKRGTSRASVSWRSLGVALRHPGVAQLLLLYLGVTTSFALMEQVIGLYIEHWWVPLEPGVTLSSTAAEARAQEAAALTTWLLVVVGVTAIIVQGGLVGRLAKAIGEKRVLVAGIAIEAVGLACLPWIGPTQSFALLLVGGIVLAVGTGLANPSLSALLSLSVDDTEQGGTLGLGQSLSALGRVIGPASAGLLFEAAVGLPFTVAAGIMAACVAVALTVRTPTA